MHMIRMLGLVVVTGLISACGGGDSSQQPVQEQEQVKPQPDLALGSLAVVSQDNDRTALSLYDLSQNKTVLHTPLKQLPLAIYSSPNYGYAVMMDRVAGEVSFVAAGQQPKILDYRLYGAAPTHYRQVNGQAAVFYDGSDTQVSKFDVFSDQDIAKGLVASQHLPYKHHGVAEPRGNMVLSSYLAEGETQVSMVKSYAQHGDHYHEEQTLTHACPSLHGAASNQNFIAFGCQDGVLLVEQQGQRFIDTKITTPVRIGTLLGHEKVSDLVAIASTQQELFIVDTDQQQADMVVWNNQDLKRLKQNFSSTGQYFVILDDQGGLSILDSNTWQVLHYVPVLSQDALAQAQLAMHGTQDQVFINDANTKQIVQIDLSTGQIVQRIQLDVVPQQMAWLKHSNDAK
jgi:hypothetical protein